MSPVHDCPSPKIYQEDELCDCTMSFMEKYIHSYYFGPGLIVGLAHTVGTSTLVHPLRAHVAPSSSRLVVQYLHSSSGWGEASAYDLFPAVLYLREDGPQGSPGSICVHYLPTVVKPGMCQQGLRGNGCYQQCSWLMKKSYWSSISKNLVV